MAAHLTGAVKVLFASGSEATIAIALEKMRGIFPELALVVVAEFPPPEGVWIPYHVKRSWRENYAHVRSRLRGAKVRIAAVILEPRTPHSQMRRVAFALAPFRYLAFYEEGDHFMLHPRSATSIVRYLGWRTGNFFRWHLGPRGAVERWRKRIANPREPWKYRVALSRARFGKPAAPRPAAWPSRILLPGIAVVIPSRDGCVLLERCLPRIEGADEIVVVDNGSSDGTAEWLARKYPRVVVESSAEPLGFAAAMNRGLQRARYTHVCALNNDMLVERGFFGPSFLETLRRAFQDVPELFAATAQIFFPEGQRREETGKTVFVARRGPEEFPIRCDDPIEGEDQSYVLYASGGSTLYDAKKLAELGGFDSIYDPAYVEDLDLGVRAWQRGWPSVYCAQARVLHLHRSTTSRVFSPAELDAILERNLVQFLARSPGDAFRTLWAENVLRLKALGKSEALAMAAETPARHSGTAPDQFLQLCNGDVAVFPGRERSEKPKILVASPYLPFPLSHGAAVRIYNLMRRAARDFDQVLVVFVEEPGPVPPELLEICVEVVTVRRAGSHALPSTPRPDTVEEFDSPAFHAALRQTVAKWRPRVVQLEFTQMAQYAADCVGAKTLLVEHDVTYDLYAQMLEQNPVDAWELRRQHQRWVAFETRAWRDVDRVVTMSDKDRALIPGSIAIPNGVDLERFQPGTKQPEARRLLFIGSFAHRPNVLACEFFLRKVWPKLHGATLHIIAGRRHEQFWTAEFPSVEIEGFVADVRPAYERAAVVIAPLVASAGTNIKIMEGMAMGKAIVSTEAGIHGLELERGVDVIVADSADEMAREIERLLDFPDEREVLERRARETAERVYGWDAIAERQRELYESLLAKMA